MTKNYQFFRWFPADAETDENYSSLSLEELGLFHRCLNYCWLNDGLPGTTNEVAAVLRIPHGRLLKLWAKVGTMFQLTDTAKPRFVNGRLEMERKHALAKSEAASRSVSVREEMKRLRSSNDVSNDHLRASASASVSVSASPGGAGGAPSASPPAAKILLPGYSTEWPLTTAAIRRRDLAVDDLFVRRLADTTAQTCISAGDMEEFDDEDLARAVEESYAGHHGKNGHGTGLLLRRVPQIILAWGNNGKTN